MTQVHQTFISQTLIDFLETLGEEKDGQLRTKLLLSANLLKIIRDNFPTEEEFLKAIPYMADIEKGILEDFLPNINLIKNNKDSRSSYYYDKIFLMAMFIAQELLFNLKNQKHQHSEKYKHINRAINDVLAGKLKEEPLEMVEEFVDKLDFFQNRRLMEIINYRFHNKDFQAFLNYEENKNEVENKINEYTESIKNTQLDITKFITDNKINVDNLANELKNLETGYNFIGLSKGFQDLLAQKNEDSNKKLKLIFIIGLLIISPLIIKIILNDLSGLAWQEIAFGVSLELILIYFFRIALSEYNAVKTQIMQLELRVSLCQFIQSYAEYAKEIKQNDPSALEKFENVIFSNILADSKNLPSTFDGVEQIGNLIKNMKG